MTTRLLTGSTGFVGGAIALELLDRTDDEIYALVRARDDSAAQLRLHGALFEMAVSYGRPDLIDAIRSRTRAVSGDTTAGFAQGLPGVGRVDDVWHCAASLRYEESHQGEIEASNIEGTRNVLDLARALGAESFHHVSTAYVAGTTEGLIPEGPAPDLSFANNCYERSKIEAERMLVAQASDIRLRVIRPSVVIGHSRTRHGVNWSGVYGFARLLLRFRLETDKRLGTFLSHARVRMMADPAMECNVIPVDYVARNAVSIGLSDSPHTFFHVANSAAPTVGEGVGVIMGLLGLREPQWVSSRDSFTAIDEAVDSGMDFYRSYLDNPKQFDMSNTDSVCGRGASHVPLSSDDLGDFFRYFLRDEPGFDSIGRAPTRVLHAAPKGSAREFTSRQPRLAAG